MTRSGERKTIGDSAVRELAHGFEGQVAGPGEAGYDEGRLLWNGMFDPRPSLVARCASAGDVVRAIRFARKHDLLVAVRGGGYGWLRRKCGLSCDNLLSAEVVTVDGKRLTASANENADLFWGIRGGGGNFGIVTSFEFQLQPNGPQIMYAAVLYPLEQGVEVISAWRDFMAEAPDEITSDVTPWTVPDDPELPAEIHGRDIVMLEAAYAGPAEKGERALTTCCRCRRGPG